ncbi:putative F-box protein At4g05475 [Apium graveolens]|uniref:putative F-box protein At4g05475 n=1 Tax=Apium graveolens TaxID=4045 RepID=UPI003D7BD9A0
MVKKLPLLEELHLYCVDISKEAIEVAGRCCPQLKSFTLNNHDYECPHIGCDEDALAIAKFMPGLRHLQLLGNNITNDGLRVILENYPHLELLDIRHCSDVRYYGSDLARSVSDSYDYYDDDYDNESSGVSDIDSDYDTFYSY